MARLVVQSTIDFQFLAFLPTTSSIGWTPSLQTALLYGVAPDAEHAQQIAMDYATPGCYVIVDLDMEPGT